MGEERSCLARAALWLFLAAIPALADGGPHVASVNNGSSSLTADSCAGCHRAHTAQGALLLKTDRGVALPDVPRRGEHRGHDRRHDRRPVRQPAQHDVAAGAGTQLGALRNGGFEQARIGSGNPAGVLLTDQIVIGG